ncbi:hypothetical protein LCGC14_0889200 [marine sediment metagenome]|uniref:Phage major capsid protein n=1 Tax=marine sediment metagenome TaxID=412755 RepID=A0A0F9P4L1_9ZZZZ|nr:hypothetical protein [bacterium]
MSKLSEGRFEFYEECASQWFTRLESKDKKLMNELTNDIIKKPSQYVDIYTKREYEARAQSINASMPSESLYTLDNYVARTFYDATPMVEMLAPVTGVNTSKANESKVYSGTDYGTAKLVGAHGSFNNPPMIAMDIDPTFIKALGVHAGYMLNFNEIDEAGLYDIEWFHALKCGEKTGTLHDQKVCLGEGAEDAEADTTLINGIHNYTGLQSGKFGVGDNVLTTSDDLRTGLFTALAALKSVKEPGENILITTSGPHTEALLLKDTYGVTDMSIIKRDFFDTGYIAEWWVDNNIEADTNAVGTGRAMVLKRSVNTIKREIVYPLQSRMMLDKEFDDDVKVMIMIMDIYKMYNANAGFICDGDCTTTTEGISDNKRVL